MHISPKLLVSALLIAAVPATIGIALTTQNLQQKADQPLIHCGPDGNGNTNQCPSGYTCKFINPVATQAGGFCIPLPSSATTPTPQPVSSTALSCNDCQTAGQDTLCFNVHDKVAYCGNGNKVTNASNNADLNTLCLRCPAQPTTQPTPTGTCLPRPACLDAVPPCRIVEPFGGWCPPTNPTPTIPQGCKPIPCTLLCSKNNPNCCSTRFICPPSVSPINQLSVMITTPQNNATINGQLSLPVSATVKPIIIQPIPVKVLFYLDTNATPVAVGISDPKTGTVNANVSMMGYHHDDCATHQVALTAKAYVINGLASDTVHFTWTDTCPSPSTGTPAQ